MKSKAEVERLEKLIVQLQGLHTEISQLAKKSPNDGFNLFKLRLVNKVLEVGNTVLSGRYRPFEDFAQFEEDGLPTNSDVTMILIQYMEQAERFRSDNVILSGHQWQYVVDGTPCGIQAKPPTRIGANYK